MLCGFEIIPKTVSTRGCGERIVQSVPISAYLIETNAGLVLFDTGLDPASVADWDPAPVVWPEHTLLGQLRTIGVTPGDVGTVILSHLHADHSGNLKHFGHARVHLQKLEHTHAFGVPPPKAYAPRDYAPLGLDWQLEDGDWTLLPGVRALLTRGHTPGHQSLVVDLPRTGRVVLTADAGDLSENFDDEVLPGESVDDQAALASIRRLKREASGGKLLIGHDPTLVQTLKRAPLAYD